ncbi:MAG: hypothetical protein HOP12_02825 [Candidatus Eisenbacteria bacterium]|uniref:Lipoprotein LpqB beta-propeller domain-containing protein n=1 Tax=Eiseniibacteriota bacterium TaxID=2212470 RepID=A0A849SKJ2_UNCEI|nr:hypothetical protein [Candidatus Eisenbacteria bacterium]
MTAPTRSGQLIPFALILFAGVLIGSFTLRLATPPPPEPPRFVSITEAGAADESPAVSPDGRWLVWFSEFGGALGVWKRPLAGGQRSPIATGAVGLPRFTADARAVLVTASDSTSTSVYRIALADGRSTRVLSDALDADPSLDGRWLAYLRRESRGDAIEWVLAIADSAGRGEKIVHREHGRGLRGPRWSPDAKRLAVSVRARPDSSGAILLLVVGEVARPLTLPLTKGSPSVGAWLDSKRFVYAISTAATATWPYAGSSIRVHHVKRDRSYEALWLPIAIDQVETTPDGRLILGSAGNQVEVPNLWLVDRVPGVRTAP